jgi:hypothetical protein
MTLIGKRSNWQGKTLPLMNADGTRMVADIAQIGRADALAR